MLSKEKDDQMNPQEIYRPERIHETGFVIGQRCQIDYVQKSVKNHKPAKIPQSIFKKGPKNQGKKLN